MKNYSFTFDQPKLRYQFKTIAEVWAAIDAGKTVYWASDAYTLTIEDNNAFPKEYVARMGWDKHFTVNKNRLLRVTCTANYFGSLLEASEVTSLYTKE